MKRIFLTSALAISMVIPSFAETTAPDIAAGAESATCDSGTLNTTDGTSTLSAQWTANTITLKFYSDDTTTPFATNTCTYDGGITLPASAPQRVGYNFAGWQVKQALFDLRTLADKIGIDGDSMYARGTYENADYCFAFGNNTVDTDGPDVCTEESAALSDISVHQWKSKFSYGTVKGIARCSTQHPTTYWYDSGIFTPDNFASSLADETGQSGAQYCWCQPTSYDVGNSGSFANVSSPSWVLYLDYGDAGNCARHCAYNCAYDVLLNPDFRSAVFGVSGN